MGHNTLRYAHSLICSIKFAILDGLIPIISRSAKTRISDTVKSKSSISKNQ
jgi:hypothetical protein